MLLGTGVADMSNGRGWSQTTWWTLILSARTENPERRKQAVGTIYERYWKPVYVYLRSRGHNHDEAEELTQGFFADVVVDRELIQQADREKGSFRSFLRTALVRYVSNRKRHRLARKRMPEKRLVSLSGMESWDRSSIGVVERPDEALAYAWASALLDEVLISVRASCREAGQGKHWGVFYRTVVEPIRNGTKPPPLSEVCREFGIESEAKASNMCVTVKRRFKATLRVRARQFVDSDDGVDEEIRDLMRILSHASAGSSRQR